MIVRAEIKQFAERMEIRMREAAKKVSAGEILHHKLMELDDLIEGAQQNVGQLTADLGKAKTAEARMNAAADCANYALFAAMRVTEEKATE